MNRQTGCVLAVLALVSSHVYAQNPDSIPSGRISVLPVPTFGYSPETKIYGGTVCLISGKLAADTETRAGNWKLEFAYTQRRQAIFDAGWNMFFPRNRYFSQGKISISRFPDNFWYRVNFGNGTPAETMLVFNTSRILADVNWLFKAWDKKNWYLGPAARFIQFKSPAFISGKSQLMNLVAPFRSIAPIGFSALQDSRNNLLLPEKGWYFFNSVYPMLNQRASYVRVLVDMRKYFSKGKSAFALRTKTLYSAGGPPLDAATFGGDETVRGFYAGRYRPPYFSTIQAEYRFMFARRWGFALFGGSSLLGAYGHYSNQFLHNGGAGIRFRIDRKANINMRMDYALASKSNSGFYIAFGEAF